MSHRIKCFGEREIRWLDTDWNWTPVRSRGRVFASKDEAERMAGQLEGVAPGPLSVESESPAPDAFLTKPTIKRGR